MYHFHEAINTTRRVASGAGYPGAAERPTWSLRSAARLPGTRGRNQGRFPGPAAHAGISHTNRHTIPRTTPY